MLEILEFNNLDVSTPLKNAEAELLPDLHRGHLVVLKDCGHGDWAKDQPSIPY